MRVHVTHKHSQRLYLVTFIFAFSILPLHAQPKLRFSFTEHRDSINSIAFSVEGKFIASGSHDGSVKILDASTGNCVATLETGFPIRSVAYSRDGKLLAAGSATMDSLDSGEVNIWSVNEYKSIYKTFSGKVSSVVFSPDSTELAIACYGKNNDTVKIMNIATKKTIATLSGHTGPVNAVAYSPDGKTLASASGDCSIILWDSAKKSKVKTLTEHSDPVMRIAFSPDGLLFSRDASANGLLKTWDTEKDGVKSIATGRTDGGMGISISPNGRFLAIGEKSKVTLLEMAAGKTTSIPLARRTYSLSFSPNGKLIATGSMTGRLDVWEIANGD